MHPILNRCALTIMSFVIFAGCSPTPEKAQVSGSRADQSLHFHPKGKPPSEHTIKADARPLRLIEFLLHKGFGLEDLSCQLGPAT